MKKFRVKANANIALVKYWGKEDEKYIIPNNSSLSMTLDALYTETEVSFVESDKDIFYLDDILQGDKETKKISKFVDLFREKSGIYKYVEIKSYNNVPTAAGLASSASGYAALSMGLNSLFELNLDKKELSKIARRGSGSATRSIYGGFVEWIKGDCDDNSFAEKIEVENFDIAMIILILNKNKKNISSRVAMKNTVETSPLYKGFVESSKEDIENIRIAIKNKDIIKLGEIAEHNAMKMHATMLGANPPIMYFEEESIRAIKEVKNLREQGFSVYYTMDAGPNVKIICKKEDSKKLIEILSKNFEEIIFSELGEDAKVWEIK